MRTARALFVGLLCLLAAAPASAASSPVEVSLSRTQVSTRIGESFGFDSDAREHLAALRERFVPCPQLMTRLSLE